MAFLAWIALAAVCALIARSKGRNPWAWAGWGLLGGVISVAIILVKSPLGMSSGSASGTRSHETLNLIRELADLRDRGILSPQEFEVKKDELLNKIN